MYIYIHIYIASSVCLSLFDVPLSFFFFQRLEGENRVLLCSKLKDSRSGIGTQWDLSLCILQIRQCAWTDIKKGSFMSWLSNQSFNSDLENVVEGGGDRGEDIAHTIQKPSGLILHGNGNEKKRGLTLPCVCSTSPGWDGGLSSWGASSGCIRRGFVCRCGKPKIQLLNRVQWQEKGKWEEVGGG